MPGLLPEPNQRLVAEKRDLLSPLRAITCQQHHHCEKESLMHHTNISDLSHSPVLSKCEFVSLRRAATLWWQTQELTVVASHGLLHSAAGHILQVAALSLVLTQIVEAYPETVAIEK